MVQGQGPVGHLGLNGLVPTSHHQYLNRLCGLTQVRFEPFENCTVNTITILESLEKYLMINHVESRTQVQQSKGYVIVVVLPS